MASLDVRQIMTKLFEGMRGSATGDSTDAGTEVPIINVVGSETRGHGLAFLSFHNTGANGITVEVWETSDPDATFDVADGGEYHPIADMDDGSGGMTAVALAAGEKHAVRMVSYVSTYMVVVKSAIAATHSTYKLTYEFKA